jgi:hypothetical protein
MNKDCVINPATGRALKIGSVAGKKVMKTDPTPTHDCVINPKTGRAVKKTGALGKKLIGASATINQAVKMKIARKNVEKAKVETKPETPQKKEDTNRLHNLPEDLQKQIMNMAKDNWTSNSFKMKDSTLWNLMLGYELAVKNRLYTNGRDPEVYKPNWRNNYVINFMKQYLPDEYAKIKTKEPEEEINLDEIF